MIEITYLRILASFSIALAAVWMGGIAVGLHWHILGMVSLGIAFLSAIVSGALWWRDHRALSDPSAKGAETVKAKVKALQQRWHTAIVALRVVQNNNTALISSPWYLVIGAPGSGKTRLLQDSGQNYISVSAPAGIKEHAPTEIFEWWCTTDGAWLDTAGRLMTDPLAQDEWRQLLRLIRKSRRTPSIQGVILCQDLGALISRTRQQVAEAGLIRERLEELVTILGCSPPLYLICTKSDQLGGFKEFANSLRSNEKNQALGSTLPWPRPMDSTLTWREEHQHLVETIKNRRLPSISQSTSDETIRKIVQFPLQFQATGRFIQDLLGSLYRPGFEANTPLRGVYFTSYFSPKKSHNETVVKQEISASAHSVFLKEGPSGIATGTSMQEALHIRQGCFIRQLLTHIVPSDHELSQATVRSRIIVTHVRVLCLIVSPILFALLLFSIAINGWNQTSLLADIQIPAEKVQEISHNAPTDTPRNLESLNHLGDHIKSLLNYDNPRLRPALDGATALYMERLQSLLLDACIARVVKDLHTLRSVGIPEKEVVIPEKKSVILAKEETIGINSHQQDVLYDLFRSYQMLCGAIPAENQLIERMLLDDRRWFSGIDGSSKPDYHTEQLAKRQLNHLINLLSNGRGRISADRRLVDAITIDLGESLWIRRGYDDIMRSVQAQFPTVRAELLATDQATLQTTQEFTLVYSQRGWDESISQSIHEKAVALERTFIDLSIHLPRLEISRRLTELYTQDYRKKWLRLIATPRSAKVQDLRDIPDLITRLTQKNSPYPLFIAASLNQLNLRTGTLQIFTAREDATWIEPSLRAIAELRKDVEIFLSLTKRGERSKDPVPVQNLADRHNAVALRISEITNGIQPEDKRVAIKNGLDSIIHSLWQPLDRELAEEFNHRWINEIFPAWKSSCDGKFPFLLTSLDEVPLSEFSSFFNPVSGIFWSVATPLERFRSIHVVGHPAVTCDQEYVAILNEAGEIRDHCFSGNSETFCAPFTVTLIQREGVEDILFGIGTQRNSLYDRPDARFTFTLRQNEPPSTLISIRISKGQWRPREVPNLAWGLLRLLRDGNPQIQRHGGYLLTWPVETAIDGRPTIFKACLELEPTGFERVVFGDLFTTCVVPSSIAPSPPIAVQIP